MAVELTGRQRSHLRALAHHIDPVVTVGQGGLTDAVAAKVSDELDHHELIKVKVIEGAPLSARDAAPLLAEAVNAAIAQVIGRTVVLYRKRKKDPVIRLPATS